MRADSAVSYGVTFLFVVCTSIVGTGLLYGSGRTITGNDGLAALAEPLGADLGSVARVLFLGTFFLVTLSALVGGFNALCYLLADSLRTLRGVPDAEAERHMGQRSRPFRLFVLYCAVTSVAVTFMGRPVPLVLTYAAVGSLVLPLLSGALLVLLNRRGLQPPYPTRPSRTCCCRAPSSCSECSPQSRSRKPWEDCEPRRPVLQHRDRARRRPAAP
jgi:Mn2+/Fe2+ NRAMP family transporter